MSDTLSQLIAATRGAYRALENGANPDPVYADLRAFYATQGLDADTAESSVDWFEGGTLVEDLERELPTIDEDEADENEPCDCGDFDGCSSCHAWAVETLASGFSPWSLKFIKPGDVVEPLPPKWY
jgi:hypothetical protein